MTQGALNAFYQQMWSLFQGPMASVAMLAGIIVSLVCQLFAMFLPMAVADLLSLAANIAISMFLSAYMSLTVAGFYLFELGNQAPRWLNRPQKQQCAQGQWLCVFLAELIL